MDPDKFDGFHNFQDAKDSIGTAPDVNDMNGDDARVWMVANAHTAHPNKRGARRYADKILATGRRQMKFSLRDAMADFGDTSTTVGHSTKRLGFSLGGRSVRSLLNMNRLHSVSIELVQVAGWATGWLSVKANIGNGWVRPHSLFLGSPAQQANGYEGIIDFFGDVKVNTVRRVWVAIQHHDGMRGFALDVIVRVNGHEAVRERVHRSSNARLTNMIYVAQGTAMVFKATLP